MTSTSPSTDLESRARERVDLKIGLYTHALVYVCVNLGLFVLNMATTSTRWSFWPLFGWGIGLAIHAIVVVVRLRGEGLRQRMLAEEIETLRRRNPDA